jgi:two-component system sensor histidine kinase KdpD
LSKLIAKNSVLIFIVRLVGTLALTALVTLVLRFFEPVLDVQYVALLYLLPVMVSAALWGLTPGILASITSFLLFNYYFIQPYNTLLVHQSQDLITLTIFLIVAVVISQLFGQTKRSLDLARTRQWEATRMYELIAALAGLTEVDAIARTLTEQLMTTFSFDQVRVVIKGKPGEQPIFYDLPQGTVEQQPANISLSLMTHRNLEGEIRIWNENRSLSEQEYRLLETFCNQGALAIERVHLSEGENKVRVLEESDRIKTSLLNSVSHELRSPLAAIKASVSSLRSGAVEWDNAARGDLLATIEEETDKLNQLVGNLLDMSRIESGALKPLEKWNSIAEIATGVVSKMHNQVQDHKIQFEFPSDLPLVPSDYVMMEQVFANLISNSVKYAPVGTQVKISARKELETMRVEVENESTHVGEEDLEHIFEKFHRVTNADRVIGTGLGLSICKGIIEAHGGKIWAENMPQGFRFVFTLPLTLDGSLPMIPRDEKE